MSSNAFINSYRLIAEEIKDMNIRVCRFTVWRDVYTANPEWFIYSRKSFSIESGLFLKNKCLKWKYESPLWNMYWRAGKKGPYPLRFRLTNESELVFRPPPPRFLTASSCLPSPLAHLPPHLLYNIYSWNKTNPNKSMINDFQSLV